ncbi:MAG: hypothetical protein NT133_07520 [Alphaproteobacteria bacterium]|nr:hypothetical protein [Alphaproteobacteria bacterium]
MSARTAGRVACYTSFTYAYLSRARILVASLRRHHPDWEIWALLVDEPPPGVDEAQALGEFDGIVKPADLRLTRAAAWLFKHDVVEACTAMKGAMMAHLLAKGADKVVYFDPDIAVFHPISDILDTLDTDSIALTPHQIAPNVTDAAVRDNEITSLKYGVFNLGFIAVRNDANGRDFAAWWATQLFRACYDDVPSGIFTDQKYCDLVPSLFDGVVVIRDPGCNVASWNLSRRAIRFDAEARLVVNGSPLKFYHFTKIGGVGDLMTERYAGANLEVFEVWQWYKRQVVAKTVAGIPKRYWHYGNFDNGDPIQKPARVLFRTRADLYANFDDPFATGAGSFHAWLGREKPELLTPEPADTPPA